MRHYYAGYSYMGTNFTYTSPCWTVYAFDSKTKRDKWVSENEYDGRQYCAVAITRNIAFQILGINSWRLPVYEPEGQRMTTTA